MYVYFNVRYICTQLYNYAYAYFKWTAGYNYFSLNVKQC